MSNTVTSKIKKIPAGIARKINAFMHSFAVKGINPECTISSDGGLKYEVFVSNGSSTANVHFIWTVRPPYEWAKSSRISLSFFGAYTNGKERKSDISERDAWAWLDICQIGGRWTQH